jgi:hypothetical protein
VADYRVLVAFEFQHGQSHYGIIYTSDRRFPRHDAAKRVNRIDPGEPDSRDRGELPG